MHQHCLQCSADPPVPPSIPHLSCTQLVGMCQFVGISALGADAFMRARLRAHLQQIKRDDYQIEQEGE